MKKRQILLLVILLMIAIFTQINADTSVGGKILAEALFWAPEDGTYEVYKKGECLVFVREAIIKGVFPNIKLKPAGYDWRSYSQYWSKLDWVYNGKEYYIKEVSQDPKKSQPGDILQIIGPNGPHTAIIVCFEDSGVRVVDSNYDKDLKIKNHLIVWKNFEGKDCYIFRVFHKLDIEKLKSQADILPENGKTTSLSIDWSVVPDVCPKPGDQLVIIENEIVTALVSLLENSWGDNTGLWFNVKILRGKDSPGERFMPITLSELPEFRPANNFDKKKIKREALNLPDANETSYVIFWWSEVREFSPKPGDWFIHYNDSGEAIGVTELTSKAQSLMEGLKFYCRIIKGRNLPKGVILNTMRVNK